MTQATRNLTVTYGGWALDSTHGIELDANPVRYRLRETHLEGEFYIEFRVYLANPSGVEATDDQSFATLVNAIELNLRKPRQTLVVKIGTRTINGNGSGWSSSANQATALLITPELTKLGGEEDTGRTRKYGFGVRCVLPFDLAGSNYRRASSTQAPTVTGINGRRIAVITAEWTAGGAGGATALQNYAANTTWFEGQLPTPVTNGEWVLNDEQPQYDEENALCRVTRVYFEVVNGLREFEASVDRLPSQARVVTIRGFYTFTASATAKENHDNAGTGVAALISSVLATLGVTAANTEQKAGRSEGYDTTGKRYFFSRTIVEQVYPQSPSSTDDSKVVSFTLNVRLQKPFGPQSLMRSARAERLATGVATYVAVFDKDQVDDPNAEWESTFRSHAINALVQKTNAGGIWVIDEDVAVDLESNRIVARLLILARGGNVISLRVEESIRRTGSLNLNPMADGEPHSYHGYKQPPSKTLTRSAECVFMGGKLPSIFEPGESASGYDLVNTGRTFDEDLDAQERGEAPRTPGWVCRDGGRSVTPVTQGDDDAALETATLVQFEDWIFVRKFSS